MFLFFILDKNLLNYFYPVIIISYVFFLTFIYKSNVIAYDFKYKLILFLTSGIYNNNQRKKILINLLFIVR
ncbi:hypothetical protein AC231_11235 [Clostridium pasteurianum]|nr:hypothetical protein AC231_11235 [Clostridium pasteurianum]